MPFEKKKEQKLLWSPLKKQERFLICPAREVLYGGAKGGGKSDALTVDPLQDIAKEGFRALILRRKMTDLEKSLIVRSHELYRGRAVYDGQKKRWKFSNGNFIEYGHCQKERDIYNYQSAQYSYIGIEQAEQFSLDMYLFFFSVLRTTNPEIKLKMRLTANPGGIGQEWIKNRFWIGEKEPDKCYEVTENLTHPNGVTEKFSYYRCFIPATVYDNEHLMKNDKAYLMNLLQLPDDKRKAYLEGNWDAYEGQFFKEWNPKVHVCEPFDIPKNWSRWISFDWGYNDPTVMHWWAQDTKTKSIYVYRELYLKETTDIEVASLMAQYSEGETISTIFYPWDLDNRSGQTGVSMRIRMDDATNRKFYWKQANKDRNNGWSALRNLLKIREDGQPIMKVFSNCHNLIRTFPKQIYDDTNSEDLDTFGDDHGVDSARYFAASFMPILELEDQINKREQKIDLGGAFKLPNSKQFFLKKETVYSNRFDWMRE